MKTLLKAALLGVGAFVLLVLGALLLAPLLLKDRVVELVEREISKRLEGDAILAPPGSRLDLAVPLRKSRGP